MLIPILVDENAYFGQCVYSPSRPLNSSLRGFFGCIECDFAALGNGTGTRINSISNFKEFKGMNEPLNVERVTINYEFAIQ